MTPKEKLEEAMDAFEKFRVIESQYPVGTFMVIDRTEEMPLGLVIDFEKIEKSQTCPTTQNTP